MAAAPAARTLILAALQVHPCEPKRRQSQPGGEVGKTPQGTQGFADCPFGDQDNPGWRRKV